MAGAGLVALKRRIRSIRNTRKITKAMGLIATSKLRKSREKLEFNNKYYDSFTSIIESLKNNVEDYSVYTHGNKSKKKLYITLTSDTGLCGGFNSIVVNKTVEIASKDKEDSIIITVGSKGRTYFKRSRYETAAEFVDISDLPTTKEAEAITYKLLGMYEKGEVGEVYIVYSKFFSAVRQVVTVDKILPLGTKEKDNQSKFVKIEPSVEALIGETIILYIKQIMLNHMLNAKASEQASRMQAMDGATTNADDILEALTLKFNRVRQSVITQEISEIVSGAEAQK